MSDVNELIKTAQSGKITGTLFETVLKGLSNYEIAKKYGYTETELEWLKTTNVKFTEYKPSDDIYQIEFTSGNDITGTNSVKTPNLTPITKIVERVINQLDFNNKIAQTLDEAKIYADNADMALGNRVTNLEEHDISSDAITFEDTLSQDNIASGETLALIIAKIKSWISSINDSLNSINQDIEGKVSKQTGYSLVSDNEIERLSTVDNYDDAEILSSIANIQSQINSINSQITAINERLDAVIADDVSTIMAGDITQEDIDNLGTT